MSLRKIFLVLFLVSSFALTSVLADSQWYSTGERTEEGSKLQVKVLSSTSVETRLEITVPGFYLDHVKIPGETCVVVNIPGASWLMEKGYPLLPRLSTLVKVSDYGDATLEVVSKEETTMNLPSPVLPSKGHLTRDVNPAKVPYEFGPVYHQNTFYVNETNQVSMGKEFILRDVRGVRVEVLPVKVNHVTQELKVLKKVVVAIKSEGLGAFNVLSENRQAPSATFNELYSNSFVNYSQTASAFSTASVEEENKSLIVVTPAQFEGLLGDWLAWKKAQGFSVKVKTITNESANDIKNYLQSQYDASKFGYVVLFGDIDTMPTLEGKYERAKSDRCYVRLAGDDNYPDAFISRVSGNADEIKVQLDKFIKYEKSPKPGDWFKQGLTVASDEGSIKDYDRANWLIYGGGKSQKQPVKSGGLKGAGFGKFFTVYAPGATSSEVADALHSGIGIACYIGHGSATSWATSGFSNYDIKRLSNGEMLPVIWSVACVNGKFQIRECFAEAWLRQPNGGAIGVEAASTNEAWVPPCDKQAATVNAYITNSCKTFGALEMAGCVRALEVWGDSNYSRGNQLAEQCNLFGDCSLEVHYPKKGE